MLRLFILAATMAAAIAGPAVSKPLRDGEYGVVLNGVRHWYRSQELRTARRP